MFKLFKISIQILILVILLHLVSCLTINSYLGFNLVVKVIKVIKVVRVTLVTMVTKYKFIFSLYYNDLNNDN
jgi:hypothetical protein